MVIIALIIYFRDEHSLIAQYCHKLHNGDIRSVVPDSPLQLMAELDDEKRHHLEMMIRYVVHFSNFASCLK